MKNFLAVDWGTTNVRAWRMSGGRPAETAEMPLGVSKIEHGAAANVFERQVRPAVGAENLPALMCGMIGSDIGWRSAPYAPCPAGKADLLQRLETVSERPLVRIVPGLSCEGLAGAPDVIRGEETQLIGWMERHPELTRGRHVVCLPGTHSKWVVVEDGRIARFLTAMTGELYEVLCTHSLLRTGERDDDELAFKQGVDAAGDGGALSLRLFTARSRIVAGGAPKTSAASYLSGLLIGSEIAAAPRLLGLSEDTRVCVLGAPALRKRYLRALSHVGIAAWEEDGDEAVRAGLSALVEMGALDDA